MNRRLMFPAILTAFLFAFSGVFSQRSGRIFGSLAANFYRLCGACAMLGVVTWIACPESVIAATFWWFFLSGAIGFGLGDVALFLSYARLGSRLTLLIHFCLSVICGAIGDWIWVKKQLGVWEMTAIALILTGMFVTVLAQRKAPPENFRASGIFWAVMSALGMAMGTVISNFAIGEGRGVGIEIPGVSQAWQRTTAGVLVAGIAFGALQWARSALLPNEPAAPAPGKKAPPKTSGCMAAFWLGGTMLFGPTLGISCYQWAIADTGSSAIVLAVAATSTLIIIPLARFLEKDKPSPRQLVGTALAVAGVVWLCLLRR